MFKPNYPFHDNQWTLLSIPVRLDADLRFTGRGVVMAFIDSGFYPHVDLNQRILVHIDATTNRIVEGGQFGEPANYAWHGQMTSVLAAGDGQLSNGKFYGLASQAQLVLIKISTPRNQIKESDILRGLHWVLANHGRYNIRIVNLSVGGDYESTNPNHPIYRAIRELYKLGIVVLAAAGNSGKPSIVPPASSPHAITVGGYNDQNTLHTDYWLPYHSNYGMCYDKQAKPDLIGPAAWLPGPLLPDTTIYKEAYWLAKILQVKNQTELQVLLDQCSEPLQLIRTQMDHIPPELILALQDRINRYKLIDAHFQFVEGTSVAVAVISSLVAQLLEANPKLTPDQVRSILTTTAVPLPNMPLSHQGAGRAVPKAAIAQALVM